MAKTTTTKIERKPSIRGILDPDEQRFIKGYLAFGKKNASEAFRRAFMRKHPTQDGYVLAERGAGKDELLNKEVIPAKQIGKLATALLGRDYIKDALAEFERSESETARDVLADQLRFGDESQQMKAVERVFKEEDRLGLQDAAVRWWQIMDDIGADVVVPMPIVTVRCPSCSHEHQVDYKMRIPLGEFSRKGSSAPEE